MQNRRVLLLSVSLFFFIPFCYGQKKTLTGDTVFWAGARYQDGTKVGVDSLIQSTEKFHFRFWKDQQIVDIWTQDGIVYRGFVISYTRLYQSYNSKKQQQNPEKFYFSRVDLDPQEAKKAYELIKAVDTIPTDKFIKGWAQGFDGVEYNLETSTPRTYDFRNYWTPTTQKKSVTEAWKIQAFINNIDTLLALRHKLKDFFDGLKPGSYVGDGPMIIVKLTKEQQDYLRRTKPYRDYLNSVNDTLNHYLSDTLTKIFNKYGGLKCFDEFFLSFSKDNKLLKVTTNSDLTDNDDRANFRACRKKIIEAFQLINIDFVHSHIGYTRQLSFYDGKASVYSSFNY